MNFCQCGCGAEIPNISKMGKPQRFKHGHSGCQFRKGHFQPSKENNPNWRGGRYKKKGYIMIFRPEHRFAGSNGYIQEHRIIFEEYYKCCLLATADIHHDNGIKDDNRIENLILTTRSKHIRDHRIANPVCRNKWYEIPKDKKGRFVKKIRVSYSEIEVQHTS